MKKKQRQEIILDIIKKNPVGTQEELVEFLLQSGVMATQATVSRDIKEMGLIKKKNKSGKSVYFPASEISGETLIFMHSVKEVHTAGHMVCIKCVAGNANAAAAQIDRMQVSGIIGSLAGDDTIFVLCESESDAVRIKEDIVSITGGK